ncbi:unnamed protein product, partial [Symbiodinium sp. KB8]
QAEIHDSIYKQAVAFGRRAEELGNNVFPAIPDLLDIYESPRVRGAIESLVGPGYLLHPHRYCHTSERPTPQTWHRDSFWGHWHPRNACPYWIMALYFPQDTPLELGPTEILPRSQWYNKDEKSDRGPYGCARFSDREDMARLNKMTLARGQAFEGRMSNSESDLASVGPSEQDVAAVKPLCKTMVCFKHGSIFRALACCLGFGVMVPMSRTWVTCPKQDAVLGYYTAALKGAATGVSSDMESQSSSFRRLAKLHYRAVELRRKRNWDGASAVYRTAIGLYSTMPPAKEVPSFAAAACTWLNLALTEKNNGHFDAARRVFQDGTRFVQEQLQKELDVWIDGRFRVRSRTATQASSRDVQVACKWLATLLVAWGLLETQRGYRGRARVLAERAANLDGSKAKVLRWKIVQA